jgi:hypothetical protein
MKCIGVCIPVLAIALMASSASADQYVVYSGLWQEGADSPAQAPAAEPKDVLIQAPTADYGSGQTWSCCGDCSGCCSGWWSNYCRERHQWCHRRSACFSGCDIGCGSYEVPACGACGGCDVAPSCGCRHHCGHHRLHRHRGGYSCWDTDDCGCTAKGSEGAVEEKPMQPMEPPTPMPDDAGAGDKSARGFGRFHRW